MYLKLRPDDEPAEGVLVAWGLTLEGQKVLLGLQLGSRESYEDWLDFGRDLQARGMHAPALIIADGAPGIWKATRELWPSAIEQRCTVHALRNITSKLPERLHREVKTRYWAILDDATSQATRRPVCSRSPATTDGRTRRRCARSMSTSTSSSRTCASRSSTASAPDRQTCSSEPSSRSVAARRSSAASPARRAR